MVASTIARAEHTLDRPYSMWATATLALATLAGGAFAQGGGADGVWVSGLQMLPVGSATLGVPAERRLPVHNLGSSGQDGVSIQCPNGRSVGCDVDLTELLNTPGATFKAVYADYSLAIPAQHRVRAGGGGGGAGGSIHEFDFSAMSAIGVRWVVRDNTGAMLAEGTSGGPVLETQVSPTHPGSGTNQWTMRTRINELEAVLKNLGLLACCRSGPVTFSVPGLAPIPNASSIECFPIICITSPCPGGWTGVSSMKVTAGGVPSLLVSEASRGVPVYPINDPPVLHAQVLVYATGALQIEEPCAGLPENCPPADPELRVTGWSGAGDDFLAIECSGAERLTHNGIVHRDIAARGLSVDYDYVPAMSSPPGENPGVVIEAQGRKWGNGHVTLMKLYDDQEPATGARLLRFDATGMGSDACTAECRDAGGTLLHSQTVTSADTVRVDGLMGPRMSTNLTVNRQTCRLAGRYTMPGGAVVNGVDSIEFRPINPKAAVGISRCCARGKHIAEARFRGIRADSTIVSGGVVHHPIGAPGYFKPTDGTIRFTNLAPDGREGVEVLCGGPWGAACTASLADVLSNPGTALRIRPRGWDGTIKGRWQCVSAGPSSLACVYDMSTTGATGMHWTALGADGSVLAEGDHPSALLDYTCTLNPDAGSPPSAMRVDSASWDLSKARKRFVASFSGGTARVMIPGRPPIDGVCTIACEVYPPAAMLRSLEGTRSMLITSSASALEVSNPRVCSWSFGSSGPGGGGVGAGSAVGGAILHAEHAIPLTHAPRIIAANIGSSGNDGVLVTKFQNGDVPNQDDFSVRAAALESFSWGASQLYSHGTGGGMKVAFGKSHELSGHATLMKFEVFPDPLAPVPSDLVMCDLTGRGSLTATATFTDGQGAVVGTATIGHGTTCQIPCNPGYRTYGVSSDGDPHVNCAGEVVVALSTGETFAGVSSITFTPIDPTVPGELPSECRVTGASLSALVVEDMQISVLTCRADLGRQGGLLGGDG
ncbi:MAG TPA: hypothetical protein VFF65_09005, partial [Phycisphaerales bacterium]|nr:hypothetical protein [Phycisphaerales bacterium]